MNKNLIPTLDLEQFLSPFMDDQLAFIQHLKESCMDTGFFFLKNHGISQNTLKFARQTFDRFFLQLSQEERLRYEFADEQHQRGYTPMRVETGEFSVIADEKHFFQIGRDRNVIVKEITGFGLATDMLFNQFRGCSLHLLSAISMALKMPSDASLAFKEGNSIMRAIDYPPTEEPLIDDGLATKGGNVTGMCASKHTDINIITLLEAKEPGLQLWYEGIWIPITITDPNLIIVNVGDMLEHLSNGLFKSGLHRVVCQRQTRRFSIPYFCHINPEESIVPLGHLGTADLEKYPFKTAGEFLDHRLAKIKL